MLGTCALHGTHEPRPLEVEHHHIVPVGFQKTWQPAVAPFPGRDPDGRGELWDDRTIVVPPTCHHNVRHWIVALMHALTGEYPGQAVEAVRAVDHRACGPQFDCAYEALTRFKDAGGLLQVLVAAGEYGEI